MAVLGMPESMFLVFVATLLAGSLGAMHYVVVHVLLDRPVSDHTQGRSADGSEDVRDGASDGGRADG